MIRDAVEEHINRRLPLFEAGDDEADILARPLHRRSRYFASGEVLKRCRDALREAVGPLSSVEIADILMAAKNTPILLGEHYREKAGIPGLARQFASACRSIQIPPPSTPKGPEQPAQLRDAKATTYY